MLTDGLKFIEMPPRLMPETKPGNIWHSHKPGSKYHWYQHITLFLRVALAALTSRRNDPFGYLCCTITIHLRIGLFMDSHLKFAAIDIGSNAVRLLLSGVFEEEYSPTFRKMSLIRMPIRLGDDAFTQKSISETGSCHHRWIVCCCFSY